ENDRSPAANDRSQTTLPESDRSHSSPDRSPRTSQRTIPTLPENDRVPLQSDPSHHTQEERIEEVMPAPENSSAPVPHQSSAEDVIQQLAEIPVPNSVTEALEDQKWKEAMNEEMRALQKNGTWELVPLPHGKKTVGCRWIYTKLTALIVYVDDIVVTGNDTGEQLKLQKYLSQEFEMKDLGLLGCKPADTPIEMNHKLCEGMDQEPTNKEQYQRLVGRLIYLAHTRPDIAYAVSVVSQFMHSPSVSHRNAVDRILRYLKSAPGKGLMF
ncbi:unnamed protein product, partial [Prunus brigantina]